MQSNQVTINQRALESRAQLAGRIGLRASRVGAPLEPTSAGNRAGPQLAATETGRRFRRALFAARMTHALIGAGVYIALDGAI